MRKFDLTERQAAFVREYLIDLNGRQAALRAGYAVKAAQQQANKLLRTEHVRAAIVAAKKARAERTGIDADWLLQRLADETEADIADLYTAEGKLKPVHEWPMIWRKGLVQGLEVEELYEGQGKARAKVGDLVKVKLSDRAKRLELIGRHVSVGAFKDDAPQAPQVINVTINRPAAPAEGGN